MYIKNRRLVAAFRLVIAILSVAGLFCLINENPHANIWRLLSAWALGIATIYYILAAVLTWFRKKVLYRSQFLAMIQGTLIITGLTLLLGRVAASANDWELAGTSGASVVLIDFVLPLLFLLDWILFSKKGRWRAIEPFYWLALPTIYAAYIMITAQPLRAAAPLRYPYAFLDVAHVGLVPLIWSLIVVAALIVVFGYICVAIDYTMSGKLGQWVVLPRMKTIVIEEEMPENNAKPEMKNTSKSGSPSGGSAKTTRPTRTTKTPKPQAPRPKNQPGQSRPTAPKSTKPKTKIKVNSGTNNKPTQKPKNTKHTGSKQS